MPKFDAPPTRTPFNQLNPRIIEQTPENPNPNSGGNGNIVSSPWERWFNAVQVKLSTGTSVDATSQTANIGVTNILSSVPASVMRLVYWEVFITSPVGNSTVLLQINFTQNGVVVNPFPPNFTIGPLHGSNYLSGVVPVFPDVGTAITYNVTWTSGGGGDSYDLHLRVDQP